MLASSQLYDLYLHTFFAEIRQFLLFFCNKSNYNGQRKWLTIIDLGLNTEMVNGDTASKNAVLADPQ